MQKSNLMDMIEGHTDAQKIKEECIVCVVGCGRIGLPTACLFAEAGFTVIGVDRDRGVVESINKGKPPFQELGLEELLKKHIKNNRLTATVDFDSAVLRSDIILVIVDTPVDRKFRPDYSRLESACKALGKNLRRGTLVIIASTVGPNITETLIRENLERASGLKAGEDFGLAFSPTLAAPGRIIYDISHYPRLVAGINLKSVKAASKVFEIVVKAGVIPLSSIRAAEAVKLFQNVYRDLNLALANEFALFCDRVGIDYVEVWEAANTNPYYHFLLPGVVGGHIPKDSYLLIREAENLGVKLRLAKLAREINDRIAVYAVKLIGKALKECGKPLRRSKIAVLGVSYKANVKEPKGSRTIKIVNLLKSKGAKVKVFDPFFNKKELVELGYPAEASLEKTVSQSDCIVITVGHNYFKEKLNLKKLKATAKLPFAIVDLSCTLDPAEMKSENIVFRGLGRGFF